MKMTMKVAVLGRGPTYSAMAATRMFRPGVELDDRYRTIAEVVTAVSEGKNPWGVIPLRNTSVRGEEIVDTTRALEAAPNVIVLERRFFPIHLALIARSDVQIHQIEEVISKAQALEQCAGWLETHLPHATRTAADSTSAGIHALFGDSPKAVVGIADLARHGLCVLAERIQDNPDNQTEFGVIVRSGADEEIHRSYLRGEG
ncbi:MAG: hypothetical protein KDD44_02775 [Bdellovibrionales bacterium]|nr:hypothetical protein [Bdellovibrionales bacterium]